MTKATDADGEACFDGLNFGSYNVTETLPGGYISRWSTVTKSVTVDNNATCTTTRTAARPASFSNTPLTDITVSVNSQVDGGTASTINCVCNSSAATVASGSTGANGDGSATGNNLPPDTYTCTIVVDP